MRTSMLYAALGVAAALAAPAAHARECAGVSVPEQVQAAGASLKLNGLGLREATVMKVDVYVAALYVPQPASDASALLNAAPKEMVLHFVRDVDRADIVKGWDEGFRNNAQSQLAALKDRIETFKGLMADMKSGQQLRFSHRPGAGVDVAIDNASRGTIPGDDFAHAVFSIWLGNKPPNPGLKTGLLGGKCD